MKKNAFLIITLALVLLFAGCANGGGDVDGGETNFDAVILELNGSSVLVEPLEGDAICRSADKVSFSAGDLDDIDTKVGDAVTVTYTGGVMESYPAQVRAVSWSILNKGEDTPKAEPPVTNENFEIAEYSHEGVSMSLLLPEGWAYEIVPAAADAANNIFGIKFWPEAEPTLELMLEYHAAGIGICGTGVTFTDMEFENGLTATACTEQMEDGYWFFLIYDEPNNNYAVSYSGDYELWNEYEKTVNTILDTVNLGGQL